MRPPVSPSVARRIRALVKQGLTNADIASACCVSQQAVSRQRHLLRALKGLGVIISDPAPAGGALGNPRQGRGDGAGRDLVDFFATPRSPRQIRHFLAEE
jgi:hypothetical protein